MLAKRFIVPKVRFLDAHGYGAFSAPRIHGTHEGVDLLFDPKEPTYTNVKGKVTKIGRPYYYPKAKNAKEKAKNKLRYVQVTDNNGLDHRFFYVQPSVKVGDRIKPGTQIGKAQDVAGIYPGMLNHCHYEVLKIVGKAKTIINPHIFLGVPNSIKVN